MMLDHLFYYGWRKDLLPIYSSVVQQSNYPTRQIFSVGEDRASWPHCDVIEHRTKNSRLATFNSVTNRKWIGDRLERAQSCLVHPHGFKDQFSHSIGIRLSL